MDIASLIKSISELGIFVVIAGVFLFLSYKNAESNQRRLDELMKKILSLIKPNSNVEPSHPDKTLNKNLDIINQQLFRDCQELMSTLVADRAYIVLFHNGGKSSSGLYFQKMSCICEVTHPGIQPLSNEFQNVHRSSYMYMLDQLKENKKFYVDDVEDYKTIDAFLYNQAVHRHVCSVYMRQLDDIDGDAIGFIGIDYCAPNVTIASDKINGLLKEISHRVSELVDIRDEVQEREEGKES